MKVLKTIVLLLILSTISIAQKVYKIDNNFESIENKFEEVLSQNSGSFFIGYAISTNEDQLITCGSFWVDDNFNGIKLKDLLDGTGKSNRQGEYKDVVNHNTKYALKIMMKKNHNDATPDPETALIFYYKKGSSEIRAFSRVYIVNLSLDVDISNLPLYWLGNEEYNNSLDFLFDQFEKTNIEDQQEKLITTIGIHKKSPRVTPFLIDVVKNNSKKKLREGAIFWLGYQNNIDAFNTLKSIVYSNEIKDIREEAVMGLAQMEIPQGFEEILKIAKSSNEHFLREEAIMWLGQFASKKAEIELKNIVDDDPEIELKKQALFALSDRDDDLIPYFINLAKTHPSLTIRKHSIYILSDTDDKRAVDALIELASN